MFSDLPMRGELGNGSVFIIVGQVYSNNIGLGGNSLLNYSFSRYNSLLQLNFSEIQSPTIFGLFYQSSTGKYTFYDYSTSSNNNYEFVCYNSSTSQFFFSTDSTPYQFDFGNPLYNIPLSKIYCGTQYLVPIVEGWNLPVMSQLIDLVGDGENGYFSNANINTTFSVDQLIFSFLSINFYDINGNLHSDSTGVGVTSIFSQWIFTPSEYLNPPVGSWLGPSTTKINSQTQPFTPPMMWYPYCDFTTQCGDCFGTVIVGGVECSINSQISIITPSADSSTPINGKGFITSGASGSQGIMGTRGSLGNTNYAAASGPRGLKGKDATPESVRVEWNNKGGIIFLSLVILSLLILVYLILFVIPQTNIQKIVDVYVE